jgi:hypothetical protein
MLLDLRPNFVNDEPLFGSHKFAMPDIENALLKLEISKGPQFLRWLCRCVCSSIDRCSRVFSYQEEAVICYAHF